MSLGSRGGGDDYDVFMVDDTEIQLLTETDPVIEVEPAFSQAVSQQVVYSVHA